MSTDAQTAGARPTRSAARQRTVCRRYARAFFGPKRPNGFRPSTAALPTPLTVTGFGAADAHCAADPDLGVYYEVLVWERSVPFVRVDAFERRLRAANFRDEGVRYATRRFAAPPGVMAEIDGRRAQLQMVYVTRSSADDPATSLFWI